MYDKTFSKTNIESNGQGFRFVGLNVDARMDDIAVEHNINYDEHDIDHDELPMKEYCAVEPVSKAPSMYTIDGRKNSWLATPSSKDI
ncbi:hypothetical protein V6N13_124240 [Hibiscus sabdariffa]|uniref:Uncharacterized protein n=1 Tax=Hibiscus sabdariffa TaxID=183260 RepID=A0ABR2S0T3_9ROSI